MDAPLSSQLINRLNTTAQMLNCSVETVIDRALAQLMQDPDIIAERIQLALHAANATSEHVTHEEMMLSLRSLVSHTITK